MFPPGRVEDSSEKCGTLSYKIVYALKKNYPVRVMEDELTEKVFPEK